jgi:Putative Actinobacterial Holin-X, holin superfamily III
MGAAQHNDQGRPGDRTTAAAARPALDREPSFREAIERTLREMRHLAREHATLAVLEMQRAGLDLARLIAVTLVVALLGVTAWLALLAALLVWGAGERLSWPALLLIVAALNIAPAILLAVWAKGFFSAVPFAATLRQLGANRRAEDE